MAQRLMPVVAVLLSAIAVPAQDASFYRIVAGNATRILSISPADQTLTWTNAVLSNDCVIEVTHDLRTAWQPVAYATATNPVASLRVPTNRSYRLGFTPFPYDWNADPNQMNLILNYVYGVIAWDGDIICHHFDGGVPWYESLSNLAFSASFTNDMQSRQTRTPAGHKVFLAVSPLNPSRTGPALYRGQNENQPLPSPWNSYALNHPAVKTAFLNYCVRMVDFFQPDYLNIAIEANLFMKSAPTNWNQFVELHSYVYAQLKTRYPNLPVMVSLTGMDLLAGYTEANHANQMSALQSLTNFTDCFGLSFHPILSSLLAEQVPSVDLIRSLFALSSKPIAICETSYPSEAFSIYGGTLVFNGSPAKQQKFFQNLFTALDSRESRFVINFVPIDYDALWLLMGSPDDINKVWRNTGLYNQYGAPRPAVRTWEGKKSLPLAPLP